MAKHDPQRRIFLSGALTAGCVLTVPALLVGCEQKERPPSPQNNSGDPAQQPGSSTRPITPPEPITPTQPGGGMKEEGGTSQPTGKVSQEQAQYQSQPKDDQRCELCQNFVAGDNTCKVVEGQVSPQGWCTLWVKMA